MLSSQFFICNYNKTILNSKSNVPLINFSNVNEQNDFYKSLVSVHRNVAVNSKKLFAIFNNPQLLPDEIRKIHIHSDGTDGYFLLSDNKTQFKSVVQNIDNNTQENIGFKEFIIMY